MIMSVFVDELLLSGSNRGRFRGSRYALPTKPPCDQRQRPAFAIVSKVLFALEFLECFDRCWTPLAVCSSLEITTFNQRLLDFLVPVLRGLLLIGAAIGDDGRFPLRIAPRTGFARGFRCLRFAGG